MKFLQIFLLFFVIYQCSHKGHASESRNEIFDFCSFQAEIIFNIAHQRERMTREKWKDRIEKSSLSEDSKFNLNLYVNTVYNFPSLSPEALGDILYETCVEKYFNPEIHL